MLELSRLGPCSTSIVDWTNLFLSFFYALLSSGVSQVRAQLAHVRYTPEDVDTCSNVWERTLEPWVGAREPWVWTREPWVGARDPWVRTREPCGGDAKTPFSEPGEPLS